MKILQINLHHCKAASAALLRHLSKGGADIVLIQEPWIYRGNISGLRTPTHKLIAPIKGKTRTCILIRSHLKAFLIPHFSNSDITTISLNLEGVIYRISSFYMAHDSEEPPPGTVLSRLVEDSRERKNFLLLGGDANAHHIQWGSSDINKRGELLFDFIISTDLLVCNRGQEPTFITKNRREVLDVTLVTQNVFDKITRWEVSKEHSFSDHRFIEIVISESCPEPGTFRNLKSTNWDLHNSTFKELLLSGVPKIPSTKEELDDTVKTITDVFNKALEKACPVKKHRGTPKPKWWSEEIEKLRKSCRRFFNAAKRTNSDTSWAEYKVSLRLYKSAIRKAKINTWRSFCNEIESVSDISRLRKLLTKTPSQISFLENEDGTWTESSKESLKLLLDTHFPGSSELEGQNATIRPENPSTDREGEKLADKIVTKSRINKAISSFEPFKSPGLDGIFPAQLQQVKDEILEWLCVIFKASIRLNYIPQLWREVKVVFIPKAGKASHTKPKDFRPISLSSFLLKTLERLIDYHLRETIPKESLSSAQHAYFKGRSTETALHTLVSSIESSLTNKEFCLTAFLDIEGAFNNVLPTAVTEALTNLNVENPLIRLIEQMLISRSVMAELGEASSIRRVSRGTPQGGVLSPLLWVLVVNEVLLQIRSGGCQVIAYADDLTIIHRGKFPAILSELMQRSLNQLCSWANKSGLGINPSKTELVLFNKKHNTPQVSPPTLNGVQLKLSNHAKYLGLILDRKLDWKLNTEERIKKANIALYSCKNAIGRKWGCSPAAVHWLYTTIVRPILLYGALVWWPRMEKSTDITRMGKVQRSAEICITGALRSTPSKALDLILNLLPIDLMVKQVATLSALRLRELGYWKSSLHGHSSILNDPIVRTSIPAVTDYCGQTIFLDRKFATKFPSRDEWNEGYKIDDNHLNMFTDGSKLENKVGGGVFSEELNTRKSFRLPDHCSVYQAEVAAIQEALTIVKESQIGTDNINIFSDSQAAIKSLSSMTFNSKIAIDCRRSLDEMAEQFNINLIWVPGHTDVKGNCIADDLARKGTTVQILPDKERIGIPLATCKLNIKNSFLKAANDRWVAETTAVHTRQLWPTWQVKDSSWVLKLKRPIISQFIGAITGHCLVGKHANRLLGATNDICGDCLEEDEESVEHLLCNCPAHSARRLSILGEPLFRDLNHISKVDKRKLLAFVKTIDRFKQ